MIGTPNTAARVVRTLPALLVGLAIVLGSIGLAAGAGTTTVRLTPDERTVTESGTTTFAVVVDDADGGVGAYALRVDLDEPSVGTITNATVPGSDRLTDVNVSTDGDAVTIETALLDTTDVGQVTVATVIVRGDAAGRSGVTLSVDVVGDEAGNRYDVASVENASLRVRPGDEDGDHADDSNVNAASGASPTTSSTAGGTASTDGTDSTPTTVTEGTASSKTPTATVAPTSTATADDVTEIVAGEPFGFEVLVWVALGLGGVLAAAGLVIRRRQ